MSIYILRRLLLAFATWFVITLITYAIFAQGSDTGASIGGWLTYLLNILGGDLGIDIYGYNVSQQVFSVFPASLELIILAFLTALTIGITLGTLAGMNSRSWINICIRSFTLVGHSIPVFLVGAVLILYVAPSLPSVPSVGRYNLLFNINESSSFYIFNILSLEKGNNLALFENIIMHILLPVISLSLFPTTEIINDVRTSVSDVMKTNYIKVATSKGMPPWEMVFRHILPNALPSLFTNFGVLFSTMMSLLIVVESIFDWPGVGRWLLTATMQENYAAIAGSVLVIATFILVTSVLSEIIGSVLNPLIRKQWDAII